MVELTGELRETLMRVAHELADIAAGRCLPLFRSRGLLASNKVSDGYDPVTEADRGAERAMRDHLAIHRPDDGILGEEFPPTKGTSGLTWVLDPIDGTRAFISGAPTWGILIGLDAGSGPVLGIIDQPYTGERFAGGFGRAELTHNLKKTPMRVRGCPAIADAVLFTTFPEIGNKQEQAAFETVRDTVQLTRYGMDCYAYALLALGQIDLVIECGLNPYDIQGPLAVIEAAGGIVTNWQGGAGHMGGQILAAGDRKIHAAAMELLNSGQTI